MCDGTGSLLNARLFDTACSAELLPFYAIYDRDAPPVTVSAGYWPYLTLLYSVGDVDSCI